MVILNFGVTLQLSFVCVQCGSEMVLEGQQIANPNPVVKCPTCGVRIKIGPKLQLPLGSPSQKKIPQVKPRRF